MKKKKILTDAIDFIKQNDLSEKDDDLHCAVISFTICQYLCIRYAGIKDISLGDVALATGDGYAFTYCPQNPYILYSCFTNFGRRRLLLTGCSFDHQNNKQNPEKDWNHLVKGINSGQLVQINGPEEGIIFGYKDADDINDRKIYFISKWGPNLNGIVSWESFKKLVQNNGMGIQFFKEYNASLRATPYDIIKQILPVIVDWQENHPGKSECFGLKALQQFIADLLNPSIPAKYNEIYNCHPFIYQEAARYWQGQFFFSLADRVNDNIIKHELMEVGKAYHNASEEMRKFRINNIWQEWDNQPKREKIVKYLEAAYDQEKHAIDKLTKITTINPIRSDK